MLVFLALAASCLAARFRFRIRDLGAMVLAAAATTVILLPASAVLEALRIYAGRAVVGRRTRVSLVSLSAGRSLPRATSCGCRRA